jgi:Domain of unknown function (DUF4434)
MKRKLYYFAVISLLLLLVTACGSIFRKQCMAFLNPTPPHFSGTFIQILPDVQAHWTANQWSILFDHLKALGIQNVVIQWSAYHEENTFPFENKAPTPLLALGSVIQLADQFNMQVYVGLNYDGHYWHHIEKEPPLVAQYLQNLGRQNALLAQNLMSHFSKHPSFAGWYITDEIDDINWNTPDRRPLLITYLGTLAKQLHELTPNKPVMLSGFSNAALTPFDLKQLWYDILHKTSVDSVLFQDGIGVNKLTLAQLADYFSAVQSAAQTNHKSFDVVIEVFKQIAGEPINTHEFKAISATPQRVTEQMTIAADFSQRLFAFSVPEYMTPEMGSEAQQLYDHFRLPPTEPD